MNWLTQLLPNWVSPEQVLNTGKTYIKRQVTKKDQKPRKEMSQKEEMDLYSRIARQSYQIDRKNDIKGYDLDPENSTLKRAVYYNPSTNHYIVAQRGTKTDDVDDIKDDYAILHNKLNKSKRHQDELKWLREFSKEKDVTLTGHSLGSNHAKLLALETGLPMVGFSEGSAPTFENIGTNAITNNSNIKNYKVGYDPISFMNPFSTNIKPKKEFASNPHALDHFMDIEGSNIDKVTEEMAKLKKAAEDEEKKDEEEDEEDKKD